MGISGFSMALSSYFVFISGLLVCFFLSIYVIDIEILASQAGSKTMQFRQLANPKVCVLRVGMGSLFSRLEENLLSLKSLDCMG